MRMASDYTPRLRIPVFRHSRLLAPRPAGFGAPANRSDFFTEAPVNRTLAPADLDQCRGRQGEFCSTFVPMRPKKRGAQETLHARNSPPTHQIRDVAAPSRFATHPLQSVHRKRADPMCPSTQPTAGAKSPCERLTTAHRRDFTSHTPRSGVSLHVLHAAQRRVSES